LVQCRLVNAVKSKDVDRLVTQTCQRPAIDGSDIKTKRQ